MKTITRYSATVLISDFGGGAQNREGKIDASLAFPACQAISRHESFGIMHWVHTASCMEKATERHEAIDKSSTDEGIPPPLRFREERSLVLGFRLRFLP